jgi:hypothetical protein
MHDVSSENISDDTDSDEGIRNRPRLGKKKDSSSEVLVRITGSRDVVNQFVAHDHLTKCPCPADVLRHNTLDPVADLSNKERVIRIRGSVDEKDPIRVTAPSRLASSERTGHDHRQV